MIHTPTTSIPTASKSYPRPAHYELLTLELDTTSRIVMLQSENGRLDLECIFVGAFSGNELYKRVYHLKGDFTFYAVRSNKFPGKYYLLQWVPQSERYGCSCYESKRYGTPCTHAAEVNQYAMGGALCLNFQQD